MRTRLPRPAAALAALLLLPLPRAAAGSDDGVVRTGPGPAPVDEFHPDRSKPVEPAYGGRVIIHLASMPKHMGRTTENSAVVNWMLYALHERLAQQDWEYWDLKPTLSKRWDTEDMVVLKPGSQARYEGVARSIGSGERERWVVYGKVRMGEDGARVTPVSAGNPIEGSVTVAPEDVASVERATVFTFYLRDGVKWHDGHPFDAEDVRFSWEVYDNPYVDCDSIRSYFQNVLAAEVVDPLTIRFFYEEQYFLALETIADMHIMPRHLYDLSDPDNPDYDPKATQEQQGTYINTNPHNRDQFVGLGPYRMKEWTNQYIEVERNPDYFDESRAGYVDVIRWRYIDNDDTAFQALINGELDFFARVKSEDYFGAATESPAFTRNFYKGYYYTGTYGYTAWNMRRPLFSDQRVRHALAHAFDMQEYLRTQYHGLAIQVTGPQNYFSKGYDHDLEPLAYDPDLAEELLAEAGWYDRDGDGIIDKDGIPFHFEFLYPSGNKASETFGLKYQEALTKLGIKMDMAAREWASFLERVYDRDFDAINLAWVPPLESDPTQLWHSSGAPVGVRGSNHSGVADPVVDELIARGKRELDEEKRAAIWRQLHRRIYEIQPYLFMLNSPRKFAMNKKIRGMQTFKIAPGYSVRRWFYPAGTPGTRPTRLPMK